MCFYCLETSPSREFCVRSAVAGAARSAPLRLDWIIPLEVRTAAQQIAPHAAPRSVLKRNTARLISAIPAASYSSFFLRRLHEKLKNSETNNRAVQGVRTEERQCTDSADRRTHWRCRISEPGLRTFPTLKHIRTFFCCRRGCLPRYLTMEPTED
ncbi:hypothetical protein ILYODFUR_031128 [Ilyodon furcidens]|uniref:Uncharacterized protein n=1 Tax=Ilyodon furcidens TaxID=33524 RepID=A0ABV0VIM3_9TELE